MLALAPACSNTEPHFIKDTKGQRHYLILGLAGQDSQDIAALHSSWEHNLRESRFSGKQMGRDMYEIELRVARCRVLRKQPDSVTSGAIKSSGCWVKPSPGALVRYESKLLRPKENDSTVLPIVLSRDAAIELVHAAKACYESGLSQYWEALGDSHAETECIITDFRKELTESARTPPRRYDETP